MNDYSLEVKEEELLKEKRTLWDTLVKRGEEIGVEDGAREIVVALNANNLPTAWSCGGHVDTSIEQTDDYWQRNPWVYFELCEHHTYPSEDSEEGRASAALFEVRKGMTTEVPELIEEFYKTRTPQNGVRLMFSKVGGLDYLYRLDAVSDGPDIITEDCDLSCLNQKLFYQQEEMRAFAKFLEDRYLSPSRPISHERG
ncbi:MAG: hypothetical protein WCV68_00625 [Candidatus Paceibacterota bacterium]|jgi:hypothetical protein